MWAAATYGLATRDVSFFDTPVRFSGSSTTASLWEHVKLAFAHQQSLLGPHGEFEALSTGDWSDLLPTYSGMTESDLVVAQCAYVYPELAEVADLRGDHAFATRAAGGSGPPAVDPPGPVDRAGAGTPGATPGPSSWAAG